MSAADRRSCVSLILVSRSYPPVLGGSEIEAQRVCGALLERGHRVMVLCAGGEPMPAAQRWTDPCGVPVRTFGGRWPARLRDYGFALGVAWTLFRERRRYQLVYFLMQGMHLAVGLPVARSLRKPIVMKVSGSNIITTMRQSRLGRLELRWLRKWARRVMILNTAMASEAAAARFAPEQLLWMPNPVDTEEFSPCNPSERDTLRGRLGVSPAEATVVYVGRLAPEKELGSLVAAFAVVARRVPAACLVLVGDGPERAPLQRQAEQLGLESRVRFAGRQSSTGVRQWLQAADVFALVSSLEGFPCSLAEAMSAGLPTVVSDIPANTQLVDDGVHGLRVRTGDSADIAAALVALLSDPQMRAAQGRSARRRILENYSVEKVVVRYEALFSAALAPDA